MKPNKFSLKPVLQRSFEFAQKKRVTRREKFLGEMEQIMPWARLFER